MSARSASSSGAGPSDSTVPCVRPRQIHRYEILSELGRGSMGRVYLATDPNIDRRIALKVLTPERLRGHDNDEIRQRFLQEAKAAGGLSHRGIVTIYDADTDPESGKPYLAMEWVPGCSLKELLRREGPLQPERAVAMAAQVARALDYAHRCQVVHRDIKPANLLVAGGETEPVKVVDFGIAKLISKSLTQPGRVLGSPYYMAPEQVRGLDVDGRTDLFSLGAVLYECLTGKVAFGGETVANVTHNILAVDPHPIEVYSPEVLASLRAVVRRALEKLPQDRYRSGAEMAAALETVASELALGHAPASFPALREGGDTTTQIMAERQLSAGISGRPADSAIVASGSPRARRQGLMGLTLGALLVIVGVLMGRSLGPGIPDEADSSESPGVPATVSGAEAEPPVPVPEEQIVPEQQIEEPAKVVGQADVVEAAPSESPPAADELLAGAERATSVKESSTEGWSTEEWSTEEWSSVGWSTEEWSTEESSSQPAAVATTHLEIIHENHIRHAYFSVWIDGRRALSAKLETKNPFTRIKGREHRWLIPVPTGKRSLEIRVSGLSRELEVRRTIWREFSEEAPQRLIVEVEQGSQRLDLFWEDLSS